MMWATLQRSVRLALLLALAAQARADPSVLAIDSPEYGRSLVLLELPAHPLGIVVLLPGGRGRIGLAEDGSLRNDNGFLVRSRGIWLGNGYGYLLIDAPQRLPSLLGRRHQREYADVIAAAVARIGPFGVPVFLVGTSQGAIAAANAAALLRTAVSGLVLTSSVTAQGASGETVFDVPLDSIDVPVLIVDNIKDECATTPPAGSDRIAAALTASPLVERAQFASSLATGPACGPRSPHGYLGIERPVLDAISAWLRHLRATK